MTGSMFVDAAEKACKRCGQSRCLGELGHGRFEDHPNCPRPALATVVQLPSSDEVERDVS